MASPARTLRSFRSVLRLPAIQRRLHVRALATVVVIRAALTLLPSRLIIRGVARLSSDRPGARTKGLDPRMITRAVERVSLRVPGATCLTQALAAHMLLWSHGHRSSLCLGVARTEQGDFRAHAWLESQGRIVIGADGVAKLTRLPALPASPRFVPRQDPT
jgi:hypothetical protein